MTVDLRGEQIARLSPAHRALLEHWVLARAEAVVAAVARHAPAATTELAASPMAASPSSASPLIAPLSFAQERLWFLDRLAPGTPLYNMYTALELRGSMDLAALRAALEEVCRRHDVLRTTFRSQEGAPVQVVAPQRSAELEIIDLRGLAEAARGPAVERRWREAAALPFDLERGPLFRHRVLRLGDDHAVLLLSMHHIVSDGWSMDVLRREIQTLYDSFAAGRPSPLPALPLQYTDFARWQRRTLVGEPLARLLRYWRAQLAHLPPLLPLLTDRPRPAMQDFRGATLSFLVPAADRSALLAVGQQAGATIFMTLLAAFAALLARYADTTDVVIGCPIANRTRSELEGLIGFFVNTLVLRVRLDGDPTFRELLARVRDTTLGAYAHQDMPFERLVEDLQPTRSLAQNPLVQVMFALQNLPGARATAAVPSEDAPPIPGVAKFDMTLSVADADEGLVGSIEYATALFDTPRMRRLIRHLVTLLRDAAARPDARLSQLRMLDDGELAAWEADLSGGALPFPDERCVHVLLEDAARCCPDAPAVDVAGRVLSYAALNAAANRLARRLRSAGIEPEMPVGLMLPRGAEAIIAMYAVLKAGGVFVPMDPALPEARRIQILTGAGVTHVVAHATTRAAIETLGVRVVDVERPDVERSGESVAGPDADLALALDARNAAYIMHTSGSTGQPKGVIVEHRSLSNMVEAQCRLFGERPNERVLQFAPLSFDACMVEILHAVRTRACLVLPSADTVLAGPELARVIADQRVTFALLPPPVLGSVPPTELPALRTVLTGGEACSPELVARWGPGRRFFNAYGPTEVTVWATGTQCEVGDVPPIGRPMPNAYVRLLDRALRPVPVGVPGELYVGGVGLARGYVGRPGWTAERFVPDPFSREPGARMYRTGDMARRREDGQLAFVGRADDQIKVRGFRVEPGDVEAALERHAAVARAAVVAEREGGPWTETLVAFWVSRPGTSQLPTAAELQAFLRECLPAAWVPSLIEQLAEMPLLHNGKIDRRALPRSRRPSSGGAQMPPRTETEETLAAIVAEVLGVERVGVLDNFFELGGHSLLATRVVTRVHEAFDGIELPLRRFFEEPTVASLARTVDAARREPLTPSTTPLVRVARDAYRVSSAPPRNGAAAE